MRLLLDTHVLLWAAGLPEKLPASAKEMIENPGNRPLFSAASLWEITIKRGMGRSDFRVEPEILRRGLVESGYEELPITGDHALAVRHLPPIHKDPFDRILVAQTEVEGGLLLTADDVVAKYPAPVRKI
jgi:PIN domain nuclease of toxin-antitoxin system